MGWGSVYATLSGPSWRGVAWTCFQCLSSLEGALPASDPDDFRYWSLHVALSKLVELPRHERPGGIGALELFERAEVELGENAPFLLFELALTLSGAARDPEASALAAHGIASYPNSPGVGDFYWVLAEAARREWRIDAALEAIERGLARVGDRRTRSRQYLLASKVRTLTKMGLPEVALEPLEELALVRERAPPEEQIPQEELFHQEVAWTMAVEDYERSVEITEGRELARETRLLRAIALSRLARTDSARLSEAREGLEGLLSEEPPGVGARRSAAIRLAELELDLGRVESARAIVERELDRGASPDRDEHLREATLKTRLARAALGPGVNPEALREPYRNLSQVFEGALSTRAEVELRDGGMGLLQFEDVRGALSELVVLGRLLDGDEAALSHILRFRDLGSLARSLGGPPTDLARVRSVLPKGGGVLSYFLGQDHCFVFLIDGDTVGFEPLPPRRTWEAARNRAHLALLNPPAEKEGASSRELDAKLEVLAAALLPPPVQGALETWSETRVEGLTTAGYIPFEALPLADGTPLGLARPICRWPSLSVAPRLRARGSNRAPAGADLAVLAAPVDVDRDPIRWRPEHTDLLARHCRPARLRIRTGPDAAMPALRDSAFLSADWLLLVLHGVYQVSRELPSGFLLGRDSNGEQVEVYASDLAGFESPQLVFLAICGAARGPLRRGDDGVTGLGGTFLKAGAQAVVLSPIDVMFEPTMVLASHMQAEMSQGASASLALLEARRELVRSDPQFDRPYFYATLLLVGDGDITPYPDPIETLAGRGDPRGLRLPPWTWTLAAALAIAAAWVLRRRGGLTRTSGP